MSRSSCLPRLLGLAIAWLVLLPLATPAQVEDFRTGTHVLRRLLSVRQFKALTEWKDVRDDPDHTLLILLGRPTDSQGRWAWQVPGGLEAFVDRGGAVLLATDLAVSNDEIQRVFGFAPSGDRVSAWRPGSKFDGAIDEKFIYRGRKAGLRDCIKVEPTAVKEPPLFRDNKLGVVTNRASSLRRTRFVPDVRILAQFPAGCWYTRGQANPKPIDNPVPFAVSREVGRSRLLMLSDHSVFINEMLLQELNGEPDNGNLDFTFDALEWLRDQRRDRVLIVEDSKIETELDMPLSEDPQAFKKLLRRLTPGLNKVLLDVQSRHQQEHHLDERLIEGINNATGRFPFGRPSARNYYLLLIVLGSAGLVLLGLTRLIRASHRGNLAPVFTTFGLRSGATTSSLALRERAALVGDDLREYAREAVREWFGGIPGCPADMRGAKRPRVDSPGSWWKRFRLRGEVRTLWRLASGKPAARISQKEFSRLLARLDQLRAALAAGELRMEW